MTEEGSTVASYVGTSDLHLAFVVSNPVIPLQMGILV